MRQWHGFECKGRVSRPDAKTVAAAKGQAQKLQIVDRVPCSLHIAAITYFRNKELNFYWFDPLVQEAEPIPIDLSLPEDACRPTTASLPKSSHSRRRSGGQLSAGVGPKTNPGTASFDRLPSGVTRECSLSAKRGVDQCLA